MTNIRVSQSVAESISECKDKAAAQLALRYAQEIDNGGDLEKLGPRLLAVLESLALTPKGRAQSRKENDGDHTSPLDELKAKREAKASGKGRAKAVDTAPPPADS